MTSNIQKNLLKTSDENFLATMDKYNVTQEMLQVMLDRMREWYKNQPHLPQFKLEDRYLMRHLSVSKFDEEKTKKKMDALFTARTFIPEFFHDRDPWNARVSKGLQSLDLVIMPTLTEENHRVIIFKLNIDKLEVYDTNLVTLCGLIVADIRLDVDSLLGDIFIFDLENLSFSQIKQLSLPSLKKLISVFQECYGAIVQRVHVINAPPVAEFALNFVKSTLKKKISDRLVVHSSMDAFRKVFPLKYLPKDMGGDVPYTIKEISSQWEKAIKSPETREWLLELNTRKSDESKRLRNRDFFIDDMVGMRGTFRRLDLD